MGLALALQPRSSQFPNLHVIFQHQSLPNWSFDIGNSKLGESADCQNQGVCTPSCPSRGLLQQAANTHSTRAGRGCSSASSLPPQALSPCCSPGCPLTQAHRLAHLLEDLPVGVSLSHSKWTCPLKVCVLISWALCCLLVVVSLLTSLTRTTWALGCWLWMAGSCALQNVGLLAPHPVIWLSGSSPLPQLPPGCSRTAGAGERAGLCPRTSHMWGDSSASRRGGLTRTGV